MSELSLLQYPGRVILVPPDTVHFIFVTVSTEFLDELESVRQKVTLSQVHAQEVQPVAVHCTAGVGRTGVIILTDLMIACLQSNQVTSSNVYSTFIDMLNQLRIPYRSEN